MKKSYRSSYHFTGKFGYFIDRFCRPTILRWIIFQTGGNKIYNKYHINICSTNLLWTKNIVVIIDTAQIWLERALSTACSSAAENNKAGISLEIPVQYKLEDYIKIVTLATLIVYLQNFQNQIIHLSQHGAGGTCFQAWYKKTVRYV